MNGHSAPNETPPVEADETLYRQIGPGGNPIWFDPDRMPPVFHVAFIPSNDDHDGLSLIRARFRSRPWAAHRLKNPNTQYRLAQLVAQHLSNLAVEAGLTPLEFRPTEDELDAQYGEPWAHCVVVQINRRDYDDKTKPQVKAAIKSWAQQVAGSLALGNIEGPFNPPTDADPHRP